MMILRRKEIVAAALVVLIGMAGYLNWHYQDNIKVRDGASYVEAGKKLGEAQYVMNQNVEAEEEKKEDKEESTPEVTAEAQNPSGGDYFAEAKSEREISRSKSLEILNQTAANESFDTDIRKKAQEQILKVADDVQMESTIENIAKAKGYDKICVYISEGSVNITVQKDEFSEADAAKIQEIATEQLKIMPNKVKIVEVH